MVRHGSERDSSNSPVFHRRVGLYVQTAEQKGNPIVTHWTPTDDRHEREPLRLAAFHVLVMVAIMLIFVLAYLVLAPLVRP